MISQPQGIAIVLAMVSFPALAQTPVASAYRYRVKASDTFSVLTAKYLVSGKNWRALQSLTRVRDPRRLPTGLEIAIPMAWLRYTNEPARLASFRGAVTVDWENKRLSPSLGMAVAEGARIATGPNSFATLVLVDQSKITLPSQTTVKVLSLRRLIIAGSVDYRFKLEQGKVQTEVSPVSAPYGRYHIDTPTILTAVRGTEYRLSFDAATSAASAEILEGTVQIAPEAGSPTEFIERSKGVVTRQGALISYDLLPAPGLRDPGKLQTDDAVIFQLDPVPGAARYHAVLAADAGFVETFAETVSEEPTINLGPLANGTNFLKVSAIASNGLEGQEQSYAFRRVLASIHPGPVDRDNDLFRFRWFGAGAGERRYRFQLFRDQATNIPVVDQVGLVNEEATVAGLRAGTYLWRIGLTQTSPAGPIEVWTPYREFIIGKADRSSAKKAK